MHTPCAAAIKNKYDFEIERMRSTDSISLNEIYSLIDEIYWNYNESQIGKYQDKVYYEICPLVEIARYVGDQFMQLRFLPPNHSHDGSLILSASEQIIELTAARYGYDDALRMELFEARGHAPAFEKIEAKGSKNNRIFGPNKSVVRRVGDYEWGTLLPLFRHAIDKKIERSRTNASYRQAWLGVVFDDNVCPFNEKKHGRFDPVCRYALRERCRGYAPFSRVFFLGVSRQYLFDSETDIKR